MGSKSKKVTVGYRYKMGLHFALCRGPVDKVQEIIAGERSAWVGPVDDDATIYIDNEKLFGGDKREGGILGYADILFGRNDQGLNSYLTSKLGSLIPAFRGVLSVVFKGGRVTSNNPYIKPWWFRVERINTTGDGETAQWYDAKAAIALPDVGGRTLISTTLFDIDYVTNAGTTANAMKLVPGLDLSGLETTDVVEISVNYDGAYIAGSVWGVPSPADSDGHTGSTYQIQVVKNDQSSATQIGKASVYDGYEAARAAFAADQPASVTGATRYRFGMIDTPIGDNSGGVSLIANVYRTLGYRAMNPAHILRECLTDPYMRMAYPEAMIDDTSFTDSADTFYDEDMGLCLFWSQQTPIKEFIQLVLDHCGAVYYADPYTGKFVMKPLRGDYNPATLDVYDESSIVAVDSFQRAGPGEVVNEITVIYTDVVTGNDASVTVQDNAAIQTQGYIVAQTKRYPGIPTATLANRVAQRDLVAMSQPLAQLTVRFTRKAWPLRPGGVIKLSWAKLGITELICRVLEIDYGLLESGVIVAKLAEDVFGLPATSFQAEQPSGWEAPTDEAQPMEIQDLVEAPYWDVATNVSAADLAYVDPDAGYVLTLGAGTSSMQLGYNIYSRIDPAAYEQREAGPIAPTAELLYAIGRSDTSLDLTGASNFDSTTVEVGDRIMIGSGRTAEFCEITDLTDIDTGTVVVNRGILDTTPGIHPAGTRVWLFDDVFGEEGIERAAYDVVDVKLTSFTGADESLLAGAVEMSITLDSRFDRPYPPGNLLIDGTMFPIVDILPGFVLTWAHRDRTLQTATYIAQDEASIGPEIGTTYNIYMYDDTTDAEMYSVLNVNDDEYTMPVISGVFQARIEVEAERDGIASWQRQIREFYYLGSVPLTGALLLNSTTTSMAINATTTVSWDTEVDDDGGFFDPGAPTLLTIPEDGWYVASFTHVVDAGASIFSLQSNIIYDTVGGSGGSSSGFFDRPVLTTVDQGRCVFALDKFTAGTGLEAKLIRFSNGSGTPTIEANPAFNIARCFSAPNIGGIVARTTSLTVPAATNVTVTFTAERLDEGGMFDLAGAPTVLTVPAGGAGWYLISGFARYASSGTAAHRTIYLYVNGSAITSIQLPAGGVTQTLSLQTLAFAYLADGDEISLVLRSGGATTSDSMLLAARRVGIGDTMGAVVRNTGAQTTNIGTTVLSWDTEVADVGDMFDAAVNSQRIYAKVDGYYAAYLWASPGSTSAGSSKYCAIRKNGVEVCRQGTDTPAAGGSPTPAVVMYMSEGDYIDATMTTTHNSTVTASSRFGLLLVSPAEESS